jgi:hypothetical protein
MNESIPGGQIGRKPRAPRALALWVGASAVGALAGAQLALLLFPDAAFGRNPVGQFSWHLIGFALCMGFPVAGLQWLALRHLLRKCEPSRRSSLILWIPATSIGIALTILPLWWWDAVVFAFLPVVVLVPMLPGMICLGLIQRLLLEGLILTRYSWTIATIVGGTIGSIVGLIAGFALPIPLELTWAFATGAGIGVLQGSVLDSSSETNGRDEVVRR